ncbi:MAG: DMT family transporter [Pseudomonadota bacterium]
MSAAARPAHWKFFAVLLMAGAGWGATLPLSKVAVSTGFEPFGLIFWQLVISFALLSVISWARGRRFPLTRHGLLLSLLVALVGTLLPNSASFRALVHLPAGLISILLSIIPMLAFPIAIAFGFERPSLRRLAGLGLGLLGVLLILGPDAALPDRSLILWVGVALIAPFFYALEGNMVAKIGLRDLDAVQVLWGASFLGAVLAFPLALGSGQWISPFRSYGAAEGALILSSTLHALVYTTYVWLVTRAGPVFAAQISYIVTGSGVIWAMLFLGERYAWPIWVALFVILAGVVLVQPKTVDETTDV